MPCSVFAGSDVMKNKSHKKFKPKALILRTAGTNCDYETKYALEKAGAEVDLIHINPLIN